MKYSKEYETYWQSDLMLGTSSFEDVDAVVAEVLNVCGTGPILDVGCGMGALVRTFLALGVSAQGVDVSRVAIDHCERFAPGHFTVGTALELPFGDGTYETVVSTACLEHISEADVQTALAELYRVSRRFVYLRLATTPDRDNHWHLTVKPREWWETQCFKAGFRKHPAYYRINDYEALEQDPWQVVVVLEKIPFSAVDTFPLEALAAERDLHMDMMRESGRRSDAHVVRYALAARYVRPGDVVLDAATGLGYGAHLLLNCSNAAKVIGIDGSESAIRYAKANYHSLASHLEFRSGHLPAALCDIADHSVDLVVSFETIEHVAETSALWSEFYRILTPAGRVIVSVPNDWSDASGEDPNEHHLHVYTWSRLLAEMESQFILESAYVQTASQFKSGTGMERGWQAGKRELRKYPIRQLRDGASPECEWCLAVAMRNPLDGKGIPYRETTYEEYPDFPAWNATAFARDYTNPWLVKGLVTIGHRIESPDALAELARDVVADAPPWSADKGAGLCIQGYQLLGSASLCYADVHGFDLACAGYLKQTPENPHQLRWQVSLLYLCGRLWQAVGAFDRATQNYDRCRHADTSAFSPVLATKRVDACLQLGFLELAGGRLPLAQSAWRSGIEIAQASLREDWRMAVGDIARPSDFGLSELATTLEYANACAFALRYAEYAQSRPSQWWWQHERNRIAQLKRLEKTSAEVSRLNEVLAQKSNLLAVLPIEVGRLNQVVRTKDTAIVQQASEIGRLNQVIREKESAIVEQADEIGRLNLVIQAKDVAIVEQADEVGRLNAAIEDYKCHIAGLSAQLHAVNHENQQSLAEIQAIRQTKVFRLRETVLYESWSLQKMLRVIYLLGAIVTPRRLRYQTRPLISKLKNIIKGSPSSAPAEAKGTEYVVRQHYPNIPGRLKVVHIIANFMTGGSSRLVVDLLEHLGHKYDQSVITSFIPNPPAYLGLDIQEIRFPESEEPFLVALRRYQPAFIHVHYWGDTDEPWYTKAVRAAEILGVPVIENINTPIAPYVSPAVCRYVYVSDYVCRVFGREDPTHMTIYPGSDFTHFESSHDTPKTDCVGMVYRLERDKLNEEAILPFIRTVQKRPQTRVLIVGGGSLLDPFRQAVNAAGIAGNFEFTDYVSYEELPQLYRRMSVFVAPVWKESFGQVSPFAMNMQIPVVGYDVGALGEIVDDPSLLAPPAEADRLADIIIRLLDSAELRQAIGCRQQARAQCLFSLQTMIDRYADLYAQMGKEAGVR